MNGGNGREHGDREALRERLSAYLDGELAPADAAALERHLHGCAECRDELAALREVRALLRALPPPALPRSFALPPSAAAPQPDRPPVVEWPLPARPRRDAAAPARRTPAATATPVPALARAAQWAGSLAAAIGLLLIVATAVLGANLGGVHTYSAGTATEAHTPMRQPATGQQTATSTARQTPTGPGVVQGVGTPSATPAPTTVFGTKTPTSPPAPTATNGPVATGAAIEPFPVLPVAGAGLLAGGVVLLGAGSLAARRRPRRRR